MALMPTPFIARVQTVCPTPLREIESSGWLRSIQDRLDQQRNGRLHRTLRTPDPRLVDLASNDYLALRQHPHLLDAVQRAEQYSGAGASRLVTGTSDFHLRVESRFAQFKGAESALILPTGYQTNLSAITALPAPGALLLMDRLNHASLFDAGLLAAAGPARATLRRYRHCDVDHARTLARKHLDRHPGAPVWIITDSVFSMDGDLAPIAQLAALRDELSSLTPAGAVLFLDEAHATGVLGHTGAGADELFGHLADLCVSTASKALGSLGGVITGPRLAIDAIVNFARPFIYTTAAAPAQVAAIDAALDLIRDEPERRDRLGALACRLRAALIEKDWPAQTLGHDPIPIAPLVVASAAAALALSAALEKSGFHAPAIRPPSVPAGACRVRLSLHTDLTDDQLDRLIDAIPRYTQAASS